jgi:DNA-directed RNA polymerase specialized sigma24 family protein
MVAADGRPLIAEPAADLPPVSAGLEREELARRIATALDRLDDRYREVVVLADMQDAKAAERRTTLNSALGQAFTHAVAAFGTRMRRK